MPIFRNLLVCSSSDAFIDSVGDKLNELGIGVSSLSPQHYPKIDDLSKSIGIILDARYADERTILDWEKQLQYLEFNYPSYVFAEWSQKEALINCLENGAWGVHFWPNEVAFPWLQRQLNNLLEFYTQVRADPFNELSFGDSQTLIWKDENDKIKETNLNLEDFVIINCFLFNNRIASRISLGRFLAANNFNLDPKALLGGRIKQRIQSLTSGDYTVKVVFNGIYKLDKVF